MNVVMSSCFVFTLFVTVADPFSSYRYHTIVDLQKKCQMVFDIIIYTIERLDQGHLYPLGERRDKHVTGGARTSALLHRRLPLYLKSYPDSLYARYSEPLHGLLPGLQPVLYNTDSDYFERLNSRRYSREKNKKKCSVVET
jgi:hypothetical protein